MKSGDKLLKALSVLTAAIIIVFFAARVYEAAGRNFKTQTVEAAEAIKTVDAEMYIIRKEFPLGVSASGIAVPLAGNAERVGKGDGIAAVFSSEEAAKNYVEARTLKKRLAAYKKIDGSFKFDDVNMDKLNSRIDADFIALADAAYFNDFSDIEKRKLSLNERLSRKQICLGEKVDCSDKIAALQDEISRLDSSGAPVEIVAAGASGYYVGKADGYEDVLPFDELDSLTAERLERVLKEEKPEPPPNSAGKIIEGCDWYVAAVSDSPEIRSFSVGETVRLILGVSEDETLQTEVYSIKPADAKRSLVVFKCNLMNEKLASLRKVEGEIVVGEYKGLKVSKKAVRLDEDGNEGVYVRRGNVISFRSVNVIYSEDDFAIVANPGEDDNVKSKSPRLKLYDEVVVSGKELEDETVA